MTVNQCENSSAQKRGSPLRARNNFKKSLMANFILKTVLANLFMLIFWTGQAQHYKSMSSEENKVLNVVLQMTQYFHQKNINGVMSTYEKGSMIVFEPGHPVQDEKRQRELFQVFFDMNPTFNYHGHEVFVNGNIAVHLTPWSMEGTDENGSKINMNGLSVAVLRKQPNGEWLIIFDDPYGSQLMENN